LSGAIAKTGFPTRRRWRRASRSAITSPPCRLDAIDLPNAPVRPPWTTIGDPKTAARSMLVGLEHASAPGPVVYRTARLPLVISGSELGASPQVEPLGTSPDRILGDNPPAGPRPG
jgi:crotonobetainyl-CoA:carnitine CoA-transferase CaiB-like acyl-CoA transferase